MARALTRLSGRETNRIHRAGKGKGRSHEFAAPTNRGKAAAMVEGKDYRILNNRKLQEEGRRNCVSCAIRALKRFNPELAETAMGQDEIKPVQANGFGTSLLH